MLIKFSPSWRLKLNNRHGGEVFVTNNSPFVATARIRFFAGNAHE